MQEPDFLVRGEVGNVIPLRAFGLQGEMERFGCVTQRRAMGDVGGGRGSRALRQFAQNFCKQRVMKMRAHRFARVGETRTMQRKANSGLIKVGIKARRFLECPDVGLIRIFYGNFRFVGN